MEIKTTQPPAIRNLDLLAKIMDSQFRIPGTNIRFGLDALIGLVPGAGDFASFLISGYIMMVSAKNGASGMVLARMGFNVFIDALVGSIPIIGDIFDVAFKANQRNMKLMHAHFVEGRHRGSAWKIVLPVLLVLLVLICVIVWLTYKLFAWIINAL